MYELITKISIIVICFNIIMALVKAIFNLKPISNRLYCGIYGFSLKPGADMKSAMLKLKILGLFNIPRGRDASGIYINGEIIKKTKEFDDFIRDEILPTESENRVVLGHNRQGSYGYGKTKDEAHPFLINDDLVFTHNGTIKNVESLCKKYEVSEKDYNVDTLLLGTLLYTEGHDVLNHYKGAAALAYTYKSEPNVLYLYHGTSKDYKNGALLEERPLFYMETVDGIFYSSLEESLKSIRDSEEDIVECLDHNLIFKIVDGEFDYNNITKIDREEANVYVTPITTHFYPSEKSRGKFSREFENSTNSKYVDNRLISKESLPNKVLDAFKNNFKNSEDFIYFHFGRYWRIPHTLVNEPLYVRKGGIITKENDPSGELLFFFRGVLLKDKDAYVEILSLKNSLSIVDNWARSPMSYNFALEISKYSQFPVTNNSNEGTVNMTDIYKYAWYKDKDEKKSYSFTPKYSGRNYNIKNGVLVNIMSSHREKCLLDTAYDAYSQIKSLEGIGVPGGSSSGEFPFPVKATLLPGSDEAQKANEFLWFHEVSHKDRKSFDREWGDDEHLAFRRFIKTVYHRDFSIAATEEEISNYCNDIIDKSIKEGVSVAEMLDSEVSGDSDVFLFHYEKLLDEKSKQKECPVVQIETGLTKLYHESFSDNDNFEELTESEEKEEEINETIENCIVNLEDIQLSCFELMRSDGNDLAKETSSILIEGVSNVLSNLKTPLSKFKKNELIRRIDKIGENKNIEHGIL